MHNKAQIKVIKKNALKFYKTTIVRRESPKRNTAREIASTVSGWVNEFQLRGKATSNQQKPNFYKPDNFLSLSQKESFVR